MGKPTVLDKSINLLFNERFKTMILAGVQLAQREVCTWNDLFEGSGLKRMGVSTNTLSSALKVWIEEGVVEKVKAPFPWRVRYRLLEKDEYSKALGKVMDKIRDRASKQRILERKEEAEKLRQIGREVVQELDQISQETFLGLLLLGLEEGKNSEANPYLVALVGFFLVDYLFHVTANLHYEAREEAITNLTEKVKKRLLQGKEMILGPSIPSMKMNISPILSYKKRVISHPILEKPSK